MELLKDTFLLLLCIAGILLMAMIIVAIIEVAIEQIKEGIKTKKKARKSKK